MKITLKNIGVFKQAEYEIGDLTIICGQNNTGKTYAAYCLYGFYDFFWKAFSIKTADKDIKNLIANGVINIDIELSKIIQELDIACKEYVKFLPQIFASNKDYLKDAEFNIKLEDNEIDILDTYQKKLGTAKSTLIQINKESKQNQISIRLLIDRQEDKFDVDDVSFIKLIKHAISNAFKEIVFTNTFRRAFIASAERTGAVIFKDELNIAQNNLFRHAAKAGQNADMNPIELIESIYGNGDYALPVRKNIDFIRKLESISKDKSYIASNEKYKDILKDFSDIIGGTYKVGKEGLYYIPNTSSSVKLTMGESSSSVRSMLDISFYLNHIAQQGDMLIIDEPELNLHPCNQIRLARLFARLINIGIKVFITTHSDYIIKELNTLIMLDYKNRHGNAKSILKKYEYKESELINYKQVKVFISEKKLQLIGGNARKIKLQCLSSAEIDEFYGIQAESFDETIIKMNKIQEAIILGDE